MAVTIASLAAENAALLVRLEERLGYRFTDRRYLQQALIHSSYAAENGLPVIGNNERLEFLGDAVLDLVVGHALYERFAEVREGELSRLRAALVNTNHLAAMAEAIGLGEYLLLGKGEEASGGCGKPSILACAYEAVAGAIFQDGGAATAMELMGRHFAPHLREDRVAMLGSDAKSLLQEKSQERFGEAPVYLLAKEEGPDHAKFFTVSVQLRGRELAVGGGGSKKEAEQRAAAAALGDFDALRFDDQAS